MKAPFPWFGGKRLHGKQVAGMTGKTVIAITKTAQKKQFGLARIASNLARLNNIHYLRKFHETDRAHHHPQHCYTRRATVTEVRSR